MALIGHVITAYCSDLPDPNILYHKFIRHDDHVFADMDFIFGCEVAINEIVARISESEQNLSTVEWAGYTYPIDTTEQQD